MGDFFPVFILAHLTGDFVLQTNNIARMKSESIKGVALHCTVVCAVQVLFLSVFGLRGILAGLLGGIVHFFLDWAKLRIRKLVARIEFAYFVIDQSVHILIIWLIVLLFSQGKDFPDRYIIYVRLLIGLIVLTYAATVAVKILVRDLFPEQKKQEFFKTHERIIDALAAVLLCAAWFIHWIAGVIALPVTFYIYQKNQSRLYNYRWKIAIIKYSFITIVSFLIFVFIN